MPRKKRLTKPFNESEFLQLDWRHPIPKLLLPALAKAIETRDVVECKIAGTILMLAIEIYHAENGQYPTTLDKLVPEFLQEIPNDPFSEQGFIYRVTTDADGQLNYVLYSVGADGIDNNGTINAEQENDALSIYKGKGLDFSFNPAKPEE